ncbi:MAG TPA: ATP-dependent sacrificial sulfur transferase LarE [Bacteroidales bacterium]|nr:ATP-dependent sacrificial sulfur transferase LarE [Bacteroidales bacterium]
MDKMQKYENLKAILSEMKEVVVAYSGGVDSAFLLKVAHDVLGEKAYGVLAISPTYPSREFEKAKETASLIGARIRIIETNELEDEKFRTNPVNRCYFCKSELFTKIVELAESRQFKNFVDGSNFDDKGDYRPGMKALSEKGIRSPLQEAQLTKAEIRELSHMLGLPTWDKDALACLSSRFPYGENIDIEKLRMVDEIENFLFDLGFRNIRARHQKNTLKIEVLPEQIARFFQDDIRLKVLDKAKSIGYKYVTVDLEGYRQGSMNEVLEKKKIDGKSLVVENRN